MSKRGEKTYVSRRGRRQALRFWGVFLLALSAWVTVVLLLGFLGLLAGPVLLNVIVVVLEADERT